MLVGSLNHCLVATVRYAHQLVMSPFLDYTPTFHEGNTIGISHSSKAMRDDYSSQVLVGIQESV
jgi:hypothetical protein